MEVAPQFSNNPDALRNIYVKSTTGAQVPLSTFTHYEQRNAALSVNHQGQFPATTVTFNLAPGIALGQAVTAIEKAEQTIHFPAAMLRFRPIMMTTLAALFGALPLALGRGVGAELRRPLGITIVGGLIFSQVQTLFTTPVVYLYMDRLRLTVERWKRRRGGTDPE